MTLDAAEVEAAARDHVRTEYDLPEEDAETLVSEHRFAVVAYLREEALAAITPPDAVDLDALTEEEVEARRALTATVGALGAAADAYAAAALGEEPEPLAFEDLLAQTLAEDAAGSGGETA